MSAPFKVATSGTAGYPFVANSYTTLASGNRIKIVTLLVWRPAIADQPCGVLLSAFAGHDAGNGLAFMHFKFMRFKTTEAVS